MRILPFTLILAATLAACSGDSTGPSSEQPRPRNLGTSELNALSRALLSPGVGVDIGPYRIEGEDMAKVPIVDHEGNPVPLKPGAKNIALCRCGASTTKPWCDGTHSRIGFLAAEAAVVAEPKG